MENASRSTFRSRSGLQPGWPDQRDAEDRHAIRHRENQLDDALEQSFPASDPIACYRCT